MRNGSTPFMARRGGRVVECGGLENRWDQETHPWTT